LNPNDLRIYISADMEGVAGVTGPDQLRPDGFEYKEFRKVFTAEVVAAINGAREAGATHIVVSDSHGNGLNLVPELLPQNIELVRAWPRPLGMMEGIDHSFDAALLIGYHSSAGNPAGIAAHTISSKLFSSVKVNDIEVGEAGLSALVAGHFGVPVVMVSGDDAAVTEITKLLGPIEGAVVKWPISHGSARHLMPEASRKLIRETVVAGIGRRDELKPYDLGDALTLELVYKNARAAELIAFLPNVDRTGSHAVQFVGGPVEISMLIEMACSYPSATL
jgi:D-amino peptidase